MKILPQQNENKKYFVLMFGLIAWFCVWGSEILKLELLQCERTKLQKMQKRFPCFQLPSLGGLDEAGCKWRRS